MKKIFITFLTLILLVPPIVTQADVPGAVTYLKQQSQDEWITMALVAAGETNINKVPLQTFSGTLSTDYAKRILAIVAVGENPTTFTGTDVVQGLETFVNSGQIGDVNLLNDDAWGLLALKSAGVGDSDAGVVAAKNYLLTHQNSDGGWGYSLTSGSDTNDTAAVLMTLGEVGINSGTQVEAAMAYLHQAQNSDGGFAYTAGSSSDSGSTSWVWSALKKLNQPVSSWTKGSNTPNIFLESLQMPDGSYKWQASDTAGSPVMTAYSVIALSGAWYPVKSPTQTGSNLVSLRIEGSSNTLCQAQVAATTALDLVAAAATVCNYIYHIQTTAYGPYLDKIGSDQAAGETGWLYLVNYKQASVGAGDYRLKAGDEVLWYYGAFTWKPLKLSVTPEEVAAGASINIVTTSFDEASSSWVPEKGVSVSGAGSPLTTNDQGQASFNLAGSTNLSLLGEKTGFIRSARKVVRLSGASDSQTVNLDVMIEPGTSDDGGSKASFTVSATNLSLGSLKPGQIVEREVVLTNTSQANLYFEAQVSGDDVFNKYLQLNRQAWDSWQAQIASAKNLSVAVRLPLPSNTKDTGHKTGKLVFWAAAK